jgi:hypothetical protein
MTKDTRRNVLLLLGSVLVSLVLGEAGIRTYDAVRGAGFFAGRRNPLARPKASVADVLEGDQLVR